MFVHTAVLLAANVLLAFISAALANSQRTDWVLAPFGEDCHQACSTMMEGGGSFCRVEGMNQLNSAERLRYVDSLVGGRCDDFSRGQLWGNEPAFYNPRYCVYLGPGETANCDVAVLGEAKYCCCGNNCPIEPHDWVLAQSGNDCHQACHSVAGGACNAEATSDVNSQDKASFVLGGLLGVDCDHYDEGAAYGNEPSIYIAHDGKHCVFPRLGDETTSCEGSIRSEQRICCCGDRCPTSS